jgi:hypothetical protein
LQKGHLSQPGPKLPKRSMWLNRGYRPQQVDLWVRVRGTPFRVPTHTYIHITKPGQSMVYTTADPGSAQVFELDPLNIHLFLSFFFFDFPPAKRVLATGSSNSPRIYPTICFLYIKGYESVNFRVRRARPEIRRPWTCSRSHTYMQDSDPQIHLLWSKSPEVSGCENTVRWPSTIQF